MTQNQINYWHNKEIERANRESEDIKRREADIKQQEALTKAYEAKIKQGTLEESQRHNIQQEYVAEESMIDNRLKYMSDFMTNALKIALPALSLFS